MSGISKAFFCAVPGQLVAYGDRRFRITHLLSVDSVLAVDIESHQSQRLRVESITPLAPEVASESRTEIERDLAQYSKDEWAEAQRRFAAIKPLLVDPLRTRAMVEKLAEKERIHTSTLYKWLKLYQTAGHVSALVPEKRGRKSGTLLLRDEQEKVIGSAIEDVYLSKQRHNKQDVVDEVIRRCRLSKIEAPSANTIRSRIAAVEPAQALRRRGFRDIARNRYEAIQGAFPGATHPLAVVQIDHTEADVILVDEVHRQPIGRPWMTLAIDVYSRMVAGIYVTFEKPAAISVGMCLAQAICPKREYMAELSVGGEWPVWGTMSVVHSDNGKEFRGQMLKRACEEYGMDLQWRPVTLPHFGGHIERLMGTMANQLRKLPGATFSNPQQRRGYDSEAMAALTLKEFENHLVDFIVNVYHQRVHSELGMSPKTKWSLGILGDANSTGTGMFPIPEDPLRIHLDFMPFFHRSVQQYGIQIDNISYYDPVLDPYVSAVDPDNAKAKREFLIRRDPRDISKVYFLDPKDGRYTALPYRNIGYPAMSAWELREVQARLKAEGRRGVDENLIFEALERMRSKVAEAKQKSKAARRQATRNPATANHHFPKPMASSSVSYLPAPTSTIEPDPFDEPIRPFDEVSLVR
ncbi:Mu transposase C-terminal domain-containing protein [Xanthomonas sp. WHRI 10064A]|uniref:Mu transposase C-terminal domain-containing protein n=1 Tax=unclassified Xanthomonas TaxID=2643310 RepID=UPI002B234F91|nr:MULTISPECIES: Mu transposase C-terminal domain-containing protein [unclassified Xanthomonas]MEA9589207.1 Mu transposase C-terminal domain-containing protein [Xanthomonas sp. WHRI 10064B]MEA9616870.1 Mu transposase C-terminal domain-containing protein [Xanthomonas sp. WHRI 10064A]